MRIFGKVLQTLRLSRRQSNFKPRRYSSFLCYHNFARRTTLGNNRIIKNVTIRTVSSKSDSSGKGCNICKAHIANILPVALIQSKSPTTTTNIMLIPINLFDGDEESNKKTLKTLSVIREHARQIEAFTENLMDTSEPVHYNMPLSSNNTRTLLDQYAVHDDVTLWSHDEEAQSSHALQPPTQECYSGNSVSFYENLERAVAEQEMNRIEAHDCYDVAAWNSSKRDLVAIVPESLEEKLRQMAISSMQLAFEMDMSNIRDAIMSSAAIKNINLFKPPTPKSLQDPTLTMKANLDLGNSDAKSTIPLNFNALIQGTVEIDPSKYTPSNLGEIRVPEFNDCVTAIAANICSTALQKGFPADISRMAYSTNTPCTEEKSKERNPHIVCVREGSKGCISPGNAEYKKFVAKEGGGAAADSKAAGSSEKAGGTCISSEISLLSSSDIIGYTSRGLMSCKAYALALIEATKRRAELADPKTEPCNETKDVKKEAKRKKDKCGDPKNNPCTKPIIDECGKEVKKNCPDRKKDKKKKDKCPKGDPCKKADGKSGAQETLQMASKKPCGGSNKNKGKGKGKGESSGCGKPKDDRNRCNSESDVCKKPKECPKPKKKKCDLGDPCNPCGKPKKKPSKPKKTCSSSPALYSAKCPLPKQAEASGKDCKEAKIKDLCGLKKSKSTSDSKCPLPKQAEASGKDCKESEIKDLCGLKKSKSTSDIQKAGSKCEQKRSKSCDSSKNSKSGDSKKSKSGDSKKKCMPFVGGKKSSKSKCGAPKKSKQAEASGKDCKEAEIKDLCGLKKSKSTSDIKKADSKCEQKRSKSCDSSKKSKSGDSKSVGGKKSSKSKCGAPKKSASDSKCGKPKKPASDSKCAEPKKSSSDSMCGAPKKSSSDSKCGAPKKSASDSKCGTPKKSASDSKCGAPKKSGSDSKCGKPKKSASDSKCGAPKKSGSDSKCGKPKKSASDSKCGAPKKSASDSKCGSAKKSASDSKCGAPKKSASDSKCGEPKKSDSDSKCDGKGDKSKKEKSCKSFVGKKKSSSNKEDCKRYEGFCSSKKKSACGSEKKKSSCSDDKKKSECSSDKDTKDKSGSKCKKIKSLCDLKKSKSSCSDDKKSSGDSGKKCKPIKSLCDLKKSKSSCSTDKKPSDKSKSSCSKDKQSSEKKCKKGKSLCGEKKSSSKSGSECKSNFKEKSKSKSECKSKDDSSRAECKSKKKTAPNCKKSGSGSKSGSDSGCKKFSTFTNSKPIIEIFPVKRYFSTTTTYKIPHGLISWRQFSSKKGSKGKKDGQGSAMCMKHKSKKRSKRVDVLKRKKPKDCYTEQGDMCQEVTCKDPKDSSCGDRDKKENENPSSLSLKTCLHIAGPFASLTKRYSGSDTCKETKTQCLEEAPAECEYEDENDSDECDVKDENDSNLINETRNEVIRIMEPCTVERCLEAIPNFSEYDVLVRTAAVAISGSDLHYYETGGKSYPGMTLGHDATGVVEEVGCSITKLRPGDRVVVESGLACGICDYCKRGCYNVCNQLIFNGFLRKYQVHPADLCHKIPDGISLLEATLTQTLTLGCQACFKAQVLPTTNVLVIGASPTAISTALCARAIGVDNICIASTMKDSLDMIENTFDFNCMHYEQDMQYGMILECLYSVLHAWPDAVINCAISEKTMNLAVMALKPCGICVLAECDTECACFNAMDVLMKNLKMIPSFRSINMFPTALSLIEGGKAPIGRLVSKVFEWQEVEQAFRKALCESNVGNKKVIVRCAEEEEETYRKEDCKT